VRLSLAILIGALLSFAMPKEKDAASPAAPAPFAQSAPVPPTGSDIIAIPGELPPATTEIGRLVPRRNIPYYCGAVGFVDVAAAVDGPSYFFRRSDGAVIGRCGGFCMAGRESCRNQCPPREWTCSRALPHEAYAPGNHRN
jgi:hypothetical protein